jgi:hypothetical protein
VGLCGEIPVAYLVDRGSGIYMRAAEENASNPSRGAPQSTAGGFPSASSPPAPPINRSSHHRTADLATAAVGSAANGGLGVYAGDQRQDLLGRRRASHRSAVARAARLAGMVVEVSSGSA